MSRLIYRTFSPSYDAADEVAYERDVRDGPKMRDTPGRLTEGFTHVQVRGGRGRVAGWTESPPAMSPESAARIAYAEAPWDRRTQSVRTPRTAKTAADAYAARIQSGLTRYASSSPQRSFGLLVPDQVGGLIEAGVPPRAAEILVQRATGKLFLHSRPTLSASTLLVAFTEAVGAPVIQGGDRPTLEVRRVGVIRSLDLQVGAASRRIVGEADFVGPAYTDWTRSKKPYNVEYDFQWIRQVFKIAETRIRALLAARKVEHGTIRVNVTRRREGREQTRTIDFEFPRSTPTESTSLRARYKNLQDVGIDELPRVLARLARRKRHAKPSTALENSMSIDELFWLEQYDDGPYGGSQSIPTARRNMAGRPGMHGLPRGPLGDRKMMQLTKVDLEDMVASGSKAAAAAARKELARRKGSKKKRATVEQPKTRATPRARKALSTRVKKAKAAKKAANTARPNAAQRRAQNDASEAMNLYHSGRASSLKEAWSMVKGGGRSRARKNVSSLGLASPTALWLPYHDPNYEQVLGQFGTSEAFTTGIQPMSRRNTKKRRKSKSPRRR